MSLIPLWAFAGTIIWVALCTVAVWKVYSSGNNAQITHAKGFLIGSILLLALAPCILLIIQGTGGTPSISQISVHLLFSAVLAGAAYRNAQADEENNSNQPYRQKSALLMCIANAGVFGVYFAQNWNSSLEDAIPGFVGAVVLLVVLMVIGHIALAILHLPVDEVESSPDERERLIETLGNRNANFIIALGFWTVPFLALSPLPGVIVLNSWLAFLVLSSLIKYGSVAMYYQFGDL
jgi:hypothetical protein